MKKGPLVALLLSLSGNAYLGALLFDRANTIESAVHAEALSELGLRDLAYFLRQSGATRSQLLEWARRQPSQPGDERSVPENVKDRFVRFPLEVTFGAAGAVERIEIGGKAY